jgi:hypothetical protein
MVESKEYYAWCHAKTRCFNPKTAKYKYYGGRGITMCAEWCESFVAFFRDMGLCPPGMTLERKDTNGNYEPGNCVWATWQEQQNNRRYNHKLTYKGETKTISQWARAIGITPVSLRARLVLKMPLERALTPGPLKRGFASMNPVQQRQISTKASWSRWGLTAPPSRS